MTYKDKAHRRSNQVKVRLNDDQFDELKEFAGQLGGEHSVIAREILLAALEFKRRYGSLPLEIPSMKHNRA